jgi:hypothetical protein
LQEGVATGGITPRLSGDQTQIPRNEKLFRCCQRSIIIRSARTSERAIEAAKKRFVRLEGIRDWKIHANLIEIEPIEVEMKSG